MVFMKISRASCCPDFDESRLWFWTMYPSCVSMMRCFAKLLISFVAMCSISACATHSNLPVLTIDKNNIGVNSVYRLVIGDKLRINVFGEAELSGSYEVDAGGFVPFPLIGNVRAAGLTLGEFQSVLRQKLSDGFLKRPRLTVDITNYRPIYVHGEVRSGGEHPFKMGLKLRDVVALAGGYTYRADEGYVIISRANQHGSFRVMLPSDIAVLPGDNIRIPERFF
jgi:protein involved in polysaccharide export with SLBB domain